MQLKPYLEKFGHNRLFATTFEEFTADPIEALKHLWRWLEIDESFVPLEMESKKHSRPEVVYQNSPLFDLKKFQRFNNKTFKSQRLRVTIKRLNQSSNILKKQVNRSEEDTEAVKEHLRPIMMKQMEQLEALLGRGFPEWTTLHRTLNNRVSSGPLRATGAPSEL
jgi:hypothetical protein